MTNSSWSSTAIEIIIIHVDKKQKCYSITDEKLLYNIYIELWNSSFSRE